MELVPWILKVFHRTIDANKEASFLRASVWLVFVSINIAYLLDKGQSIRNIPFNAN